MKRILTSCLLVALAAPLQAQDTNVLEVYDLRSILPSFDVESTWRQPLDPTYDRDDEERRSLHGMHGQEDAYAIVEILTMVLGEELRREGREFAVDGESRLVALAPAAVQGRIRATLEALSGAFVGGVEIVVDVLSSDTSNVGEWPTGNVLTNEQADRVISGIVEGGGTRETHRLTLSAGKTAWLDSGASRSFVYDYDVEIAQGAFMFDPRVAQVPEGLRLFLRGVPVEGGVSLSAVLRDARSTVIDRSIRLRGFIANEAQPVTFQDGPGLFQKPQTLVRSMALDTFLPDGKVILFASHAEFDEVARRPARQLVFLRRAGGSLSSVQTSSMPSSERRLILVNTELMHAPQLEIVAEFRGGIQHPNLTAVLRGEPSLFLFDWIKSRFSVWSRLGPWALAVTDPTWDHGGAEELKALLASWSPATELMTVEVNLTASESGARVVSWSAPVRPGSQCGVMIGVTSTALLDYEVEVAQFAGAVDPGVEPVFQGLALRIEPGAEPGGASSVDLVGSARLLAKESGAAELDGPAMGLIDQPVYDSLDISERLRFGSDTGRPARTELGAGALRLEVLLR